MTWVLLHFGQSTYLSLPGFRPRPVRRSGSRLSRAGKHVLTGNVIPF